MQPPVSSDRPRPLPDQRPQSSGGRPPGGPGGQPLGQEPAAAVGRPRPVHAQTNPPGQAAPGAKYNRYSLMDPGQGGGGPGYPPGADRRPSPGRAAGRPPGRRASLAEAPMSEPLPTPQPVQRPGGGKGPATFAEMGIQGGKVEDKECRIM